MKKICVILLIAALLLTGCDEKEEIIADDISIFYGVSSYAMFGAEQEVIDELLKQFSSLHFEETHDELDLMTAFSVSFSYNGELVFSFWVDQNGVFWLNGETKGYRVSSGSFDYSYLKSVYEGSGKSP